MKKLLLAALLMATGVTGFTSLAQPRDMKDLMVRDLEYMRHVFEIQYGPIEWKKHFMGWDLGVEIEKAQEQIRQMENPSVKDYQKVLRDFFLSTKDYHVGVFFLSTETAALPFQIKGFEDEYYIVWIDRKKLAKSSSPFEVGDRVISVGGQPIDSLVKQLTHVMGNSVASTDKALGEIFVTRRAGAMAMDVPSGPVEVTVEKTNEKSGATRLVTYQLIWEYSPEMIDSEALTEKMPLSPMALDDSEFDLGPHGNPLVASPRAQMLSDLDKKFGENPFGIGRKKSFIPELGKKIWESKSSSLLHAYLYQQGNRKIGYVRIPSYSGGESEVREFGTVMNKFEQEADALVIDQINNPGGSLFYLYGLVSTLIDRPAFAPEHRVTITQADVAQFLQSLAVLKQVKNDAMAKEALGHSLGGYPVSYQLVQFLIGHFEYLLKEWSEGRTLTDPHYFVVDKINPSIEYHFSKPILLLVNELDFSGGDFFPAILQDNKRATIFGTRTAGAGGYIVQGEYPNLMAVQGFALTGSIAERIDKSPIENLGVTPDIEYELTVEDFKTNFKPYASAINKAVLSLIK